MLDQNANDDSATSAGGDPGAKSSSAWTIARMSSRSSHPVYKLRDTRTEAQLQSNAQVLSEVEEAMLAAAARATHPRTS